MRPALVVLALVLPAQAPELEPEHRHNSAYRAVLSEDLTLGDTAFHLPAPTFEDGQSGEEQTMALRQITGSDRASAEFLRRSVSAPFVLKTRDLKAGEDLIRVADLWFALHADLKTLDPAKLDRNMRERAVEAGNMRIEGRLLSDQDLTKRSIELKRDRDDRREWYFHTTGLLLDRIAVELTSHVVATRSDHSLVVASRTDHRFDHDTAYPNQWTTIERLGGAKAKGTRSSYAGGASYAKVSRFRPDPKILLVEAHFAFLEPHAWFDGSPILRSKFSPIAQDQIRRLRREIARKQDQG